MRKDYFRGMLNLDVQTETGSNLEKRIRIRNPDLRNQTGMDPVRKAAIHLICSRPNHLHQPISILFRGFSQVKFGGFRDDFLSFLIQKWTHYMCKKWLPILYSNLL